MRTVDGVKFADSLEELDARERAQIDRIVGDVMEDYMAKVPPSYLETDEGQLKAEEWALECAKLQAIDSINTQRFLKVRGVQVLTQLQDSGRLSKELLVESKLPKTPWE
jgi:hypothetical protein